MLRYQVILTAVILACGPAHAATVIISGFQDYGTDSRQQLGVSQSNPPADWRQQFRDDVVHATENVLPNVISMERGLVSLVPEPGTWSLLFLGFTVVGFVMRGRRKVHVSFS